MSTVTHFLFNFICFPQHIDVSIREREAGALLVPLLIRVLVVKKSKKHVKLTH